MILITPLALVAINAHAAAAFPEECCGLLLGTIDAQGTRLLEAIPAQNLAPSNRTTRYTLDPRAFLYADKHARSRNLEILGVYHSHPNHPAQPSSSDIQLAWENFLYLILPITPAGAGTPRLWQIVNGTPQELPLSPASP